MSCLFFPPSFLSLHPTPAGLIVYLGMMAGAFVLGGLADKLGRKRVLSMSLALNASFASLSSFVQGYGAFLFCRLLSGIGYVHVGLCWTLAYPWHTRGPCPLLLELSVVLPENLGLSFVFDFKDIMSRLNLRKRL